jgi:hypothetical protein
MIQGAGRARASALCVALAGALALAGCQPGRAALSPVPAAQPGAPPIAPARTREAPMIDTLQSICRSLSRHPLTAAEIAAEIGATTEDKGAGMQIVVRPADSAFDEAQVVRAAGGDEPAHVELAVNPAGALTVADLVEAFGAYTSLPRAGRKSPERLLFQVDHADMPRTCAVIAALRPGEAPPSAAIDSVTLRRDIRL